MVHRPSAFLFSFHIPVQWHALGREEQAKYYELARRERQLHMQLYPDWSSRANTQRGKKRKRKQETTDGGTAFDSVDDHPRPVPVLSMAVRRADVITPNRKLGHTFHACSFERFTSRRRTLLHIVSLKMRSISEGLNGDDGHSPFHIPSRESSITLNSEREYCQISG